MATKSALDYVVTTCEKYKVRNMTKFFELVKQTKEEYIDMENKLEN
ncbi:hypothetical protein [uncultured Clostridium sp.]|nr:hypothetical protein [uncultured Clostridium sp.]